MQELTTARVLEELGEIAFATPGEEGALPVKMADKLRALELLYKHLGMEENAAGGVTLLDDVPPAQGGEA